MDTDIDTFVKLVRCNPIHFTLKYEPDDQNLGALVTWVKANKGHSIPVC